MEALGEPVTDTRLGKGQDGGVCHRDEMLGEEKDLGKRQREGQSQRNQEEKHYSFIQQIFNEFLLHARQCSRR